MDALALQINRAAELLGQARHAVALTGAGVSTPSGIPDFRSPGSGMWENVDPMEVASLLAFRYRPERFYDWIRPLGALIYNAEPNSAHRALAALEAAGILKTIITQNIDELHSRAGSRQVVELHGSLREAVCVHCHRRWPGAPSLTRFVDEGTLPTCPDCGAILKPNVILLGEAMPVAEMQAARTAARACDVMLVAGSSLEVLPAASLPYEAVSAGADLIIVNRGETYMDERAEVRISGDVAAVLPSIAGLLLDASPSHG